MRMRCGLRSLRHWIAASALLLAFAAPAGAVETGVTGRVRIQDVTSPGGIHAWLVEDSSVPVIAVEVAFDAGSRFDPPGKAGTAGFMAALLDEGADALDDQAFKKALEDKAIRMGFGADLDSMSASFRALAPYTAEAFKLFALALQKPRFDQSAVDRVRAQILVSLKEEASDPGSIAGKAWYAAALKGHPYEHPVYGTIDSVRKIARADLIANHKAHIGRDRMKIAVVGPIDADSLGRALDQALGSLPELGPAKRAEAISVGGASEPIVIEHDIPQSVVNFGGPGIKAGDPDFIPAYVMNYILGGGGFASRLMTEIREKRGLTYGISTGLASYEGGGIFVGGFSSRNEAYGQAYTLLIDEMKRMAQEGITVEELTDAKTYLTGSYALRFDSNAKIADQLIAYQVLGYDIDYINRRNDLINAVTREDVGRVARRLLKPGEMTFVVVGKPEMPKGVGTAGAVPQRKEPAELSDSPKAAVPGG